MPPPKLRICIDHEGASLTAAEAIASSAQVAISERGHAHIALAGGNTPMRAYELLHGLITDWSAVTLWFGDERSVWPHHPDSNYGHIVRTFEPLMPEAVPRMRRIEGELGSAAAATAYSETMLDEVGAGPDGLPVIDLFVLGLGEDGHTASLFPRSPALEQGGLFVPVADAPKPPPDRVSATIPLIRASRRQLLLTSGAGKAAALQKTLAGPDPDTPASLVVGPSTMIICDATATTLLARNH